MPEIPTFTSVEKLNMERQQLLDSTRKYKQALEGQVSELKENALKYAIQGLVFGGVALGSYFLVRAFRGKKEAPAPSPSNQTPAPTSFQSTLFASIQGYIISFLLSVAREQITRLLEEYLRNKTSDERPAGNPA